MPVSAKFQDQVLIVTVVGTFTIDEFVQTIVARFDDLKFTKTTPVLIDSRESQSQLMSADVREISRRVIARRPAGHTGKWATLTSADPLRFGIARMGATTIESLGVPMEVFTDMDPALAYLRGRLSAYE